jgi:hypothetical protein
MKKFLAVLGVVLASAGARAAVGTGIIFGNFNQIPIISLESNPAVDFKYFLDMQVNLFANSPDFANLATTGYWGTYYQDQPAPAHLPREDARRENHLQRLRRQPRR